MKKLICVMFVFCSSVEGLMAQQWVLDETREEALLREPFSWESYLMLSAIILFICGIVKIFKTQSVGYQIYQKVKKWTIVSFVVLGLLIFFITGTVLSNRYDHIRKLHYLHEKDYLDGFLTHHPYYSNCSVPQQISCYSLSQNDIIQEPNGLDALTLSVARNTLLDGDNKSESGVFQIKNAPAMHLSYVVDTNGRSGSRFLKLNKMPTRYELKELDSQCYQPYVVSGELQPERIRYKHKPKIVNIRKDVVEAFSNYSQYLMSYSYHDERIQDKVYQYGEYYRANQLFRLELTEGVQIENQHLGGGAFGGERYVFDVVDFGDFEVLFSFNVFSVRSLKEVPSEISKRLLCFSINGNDWFECQFKYYLTLFYSLYVLIFLGVIIWLVRQKKMLNR